MSKCTTPEVLEKSTTKQKKNKLSYLTTTKGPAPLLNKMLHPVCKTCISSPFSLENHESQLLLEKPLASKQIRIYTFEQKMVPRSLDRPAPPNLVDIPPPQRE
jgi:hypothetical protein